MAWYLGEVFPLLIIVLGKTALSVNTFFTSGMGHQSSHFMCFPHLLAHRYFMGHGEQTREHHVIPDNHKHILPTAPQWRKAATTAGCKAQIQQGHVHHGLQGHQPFLMLCFTCMWIVLGHHHSHTRAALAKSTHWERAAQDGCLGCQLTQWVKCAPISMLCSSPRGTGEEKRCSLNSEFHKSWKAS